jgi:hypothetical protein
VNFSPAVLHGSFRLLLSPRMTKSYEREKEREREREREKEDPKQVAATAVACVWLRSNPVTKYSLISECKLIEDFHNLQVPYIVMNNIK